MEQPKEWGPTSLDSLALSDAFQANSALINFKGCAFCRHTAHP